MRELVILVALEFRRGHLSTHQKPLSNVAKGSTAKVDLKEDYRVTKVRTLRTTVPSSAFPALLESLRNRKSRKLASRAQKVGCKETKEEVSALHQSEVKFLLVVHLRSKLQKGGWQIAAAWACAQPQYRVQQEQKGETIELAAIHANLGQQVFEVPRSATRALKGVPTHQSHLPLHR